MDSQTTALSTVRTWQASPSVAVDSKLPCLAAKFGRCFHVQILVINSILHDTERSLLGCPDSLAITRYCGKLTVQLKF